VFAAENSPLEGFPGAAFAIENSPLDSFQWLTPKSISGKMKNIKKTL